MHAAARAARMLRGFSRRAAWHRGAAFRDRGRRPWRGCG
jgi:hypothetical protein